MSDELLWKENWRECRENLLRWWQGEGLAVCLQVRRDRRRAGIPRPLRPDDLERRWTDPGYRCSDAESWMAGLDFWEEAFPYFDTQIGPGSLGTFLGSRMHFDETTVWYEPGIPEPDAFGPIRFDPDGAGFQTHLALVEEGRQRAAGRYLVGMPDLIENLDTLAALRGDEALLYDLVDRPTWVLERLAEINAAYFQAFDLLFARIQDVHGGNAFSAFQLWGPGKTAKLQCDISAALSPRMFRRFVLPFLEEQCAWLDFSAYHLDGTNAQQHLDLLLGIERLNAIEWTPQSGRPQGGDPCWYELYRRIRAGGKSVEAVGVSPQEVIPLVDAVGPQGLMIVLEQPVERRVAEQLVRDLEPYRLKSM